MLRHMPRGLFVFVPKPIDETCSSRRNAPVGLYSTTRRCLLKSQDLNTSTRDPRNRTYYLPRQSNSTRTATRNTQEGLLYRGTVRPVGQ